MITLIRQTGRAICEIVFDDETAVRLNAQTVEALALAAGQPWDRDALLEAVFTAQEAKCSDDAAAYLKARDRSAAEIEQKLRQKGYCDAAIEATLEKLRRYGYVDDERYARRIAEQATTGNKPIGRRALAQKLRQRGIGDELARETLLACGDAAERENAIAWAKKLHAAYPDMPRDKIAKRLASKGFAYDAIKGALWAVFADEGDADGMAD